MEQPIKIIIADDHLLFIDGLMALLEHEPSISVIDVAHDGRELLDLLPKQHPDVVLLDINMPLINGLDAARFIRQGYPLLKVIILSTYNEDHLIEKARQTGVNGYLLKNCHRHELIQTIELVHQGHTCFPYRAPKHQSTLEEPDNFLKQYNLTARELEIVRLIGKGLTNQQMAEQLYLSIYTVETHRKNLMQKLGLNKPGALMKFILENNL